MSLTSLSHVCSCLMLIFLGGGLWSQGVHGQTTKINTSLQDLPNFIGWYLGPLETLALTDPKIWTTSGSYAAGCTPGTACTFATNCADNMITWDDGVTGSCETATCVTMTIYQTSPFALPSASNIICGVGWTANTVYREFPATTTTESTSSSTLSTTASQTTQSSTTTTTPTTADSHTAQSPTPTAAPTKSASKAWIAGAVVGPIAGIAIAALIAWLVYGRKRKQSSSSQEQLFVNDRPPPPPASNDYPMELYKDAQELPLKSPNQMHELHSTDTSQVHEIGPSADR